MLSADFTLVLVVCTEGGKWGKDPILTACGLLVKKRLSSIPRQDILENSQLVRMVLKAEL